MDVSVSVSLCEEYIAVRDKVQSIWDMFSLWMSVFLMYIVATAWWCVNTALIFITGQPLVDFSFVDTLVFGVLMLFCFLAFVWLLLYQLGPILSMNKECLRLRDVVDDLVAESVRHTTHWTDERLTQLATLHRLGHLLINKPITVHLIGVEVNEDTLKTLAVTFILTKFLSFLFNV